MDLKELYTTAELAKLELNKMEAEKLALEVSKMLEYFSVMMNVDVSGLEPTNYVLQKVNRTRPDKAAHEKNLSKEIMENAPERDENFIVIPNVL